MGPRSVGKASMKTYVAPPPRPVEQLSARVRRRRPRSYLEWKTLRRWGALAPWEETPIGYLLRHAREEADLTQREMGRRLGCSQQAVAQAERWASNPTIRFVRDWMRTLGRKVDIALE